MFVMILLFFLFAVFNRLGSRKVGVIFGRRGEVNIALSVLYTLLPRFLHLTHCRSLPLRNFYGSNLSIHSSNSDHYPL